MKEATKSNTLDRLAAVREKLGTKAAVAPDSSFRMPPGVGSHILSQWKAERVLARTARKA